MDLEEQKRPLAFRWPGVPHSLTQTQSSTETKSKTFHFSSSFRPCLRLARGQIKILFLNLAIFFSFVRPVALRNFAPCSSVATSVTQSPLTATTSSCDSFCAELTGSFFRKALYCAMRTFIFFMKHLRFSSCVIAFTFSARQRFDSLFHSMPPAAVCHERSFLPYHTITSIRRSVNQWENYPMYAPRLS